MTIAFNSKKLGIGRGLEVSVTGRSRVGFELALSMVVTSMPYSLRRNAVTKMCELQFPASCGLGFKRLRDSGFMA